MLRQQQVAHNFSVGNNLSHQREVLPKIGEPSLMYDFSESYAATVLTRARSCKCLVDSGRDPGKANGKSGFMALEGEE